MQCFRHKRTPDQRAENYSPCSCILEHITALTKTTSRPATYGILFLGLWGQLMAVSSDMVWLWRLSPGLLLGALKFLHHAWRSRCRSQKLICTILANILAKNAQNKCCQYLHRRHQKAGLKWLQSDWAVFNTGWCLRLISPRLVTLVQLSFQSPDLSM